MWKKFCYKEDEKSLDTPLKEEADIHEVERKFPRGDCREEHEEEVEDKDTILIDEGCENKRESTNGSLNYEGVHTNACSQLYVGDIEIRFENFSAIQISHSHEYEY